MLALPAEDANVGRAINLEIRATGVEAEVVTGQIGGSDDAHTALGYRAVVNRPPYRLSVHHPYRCRRAANEGAAVDLKFVVVAVLTVHQDGVGEIAFPDALPCMRVTHLLWRQNV